MGWSEGAVGDRRAEIQGVTNVRRKLRPIVAWETSRRESFQRYASQGDISALNGPTPVMPHVFGEVLQLVRWTQWRIDRLFVSGSL